MITFHADKHEYFNGDEQYLSVSGVYKKLEPEKDWEEIAKKKAKKLTKAGTPTTAQQLLDKWAAKKLLGSGAGTILHDDREHKLISAIDPEFYNTKCNMSWSRHDSHGVKHSFSTGKLENNTVYPEYIVVNHFYKVTGQVDKAIVVNNTINVHDYKTDEEIKRKAYSSEWVKPEKLLPPVSHLDNCNFNAYSIKMSMYMYLLWSNNKNLKVGEIILDHIQIERDEEGIPVLLEGKPRVIKEEQIKVPYLRKEVKDILDWYKEGKL